MNAKKNKKVLLLASTSLLAATVATVLALNINAGSLINARGSGEIVGSVTWTVANSEKQKDGQNNKISWVRQSERGTTMVLYTYGQQNPSGSKLFESKYNEYIPYVMNIKSAAGAAAPLFEFQYITSLTIVTTSSDAEASYSVYTDSTASGPAVLTQVLSAKSATEEEEHTFTTEVAGAHYLSIKPSNATKWFAVKSVTITYSCEA